MKKKDPWDPFSPRIDHELHVERLKREWAQAQACRSMLWNAARRAVSAVKRLFRSRG